MWPPSMTVPAPVPDVRGAGSGSRAAAAPGSRAWTWIWIPPLAGRGKWPGAGSGTRPRWWTGSAAWVTRPVSVKCKNTHWPTSSRLMCFQHSFRIIINVYNHIEADLFLGGERDLEEDSELDSKLLEDWALYLRFERPLSCWCCLKECSEWLHLASSSKELSESGLFGEASGVTKAELFNVQLLSAECWLRFLWAPSVTEVVDVALLFWVGLLGGSSTVLMIMLGCSLTFHRLPTSFWHGSFGGRQ